MTERRSLRVLMLPRQTKHLLPLSMITVEMFIPTTIEIHLSIQSLMNQARGRHVFIRRFLTHEVMPLSSLPRHPSLCFAPLRRIRQAVVVSSILISMHPTNRAVAKRLPRNLHDTKTQYGTLLIRDVLPQNAPTNSTPHPLIFTYDPPVDLHLMYIPGQSFVNG